MRTRILARVGRFAAPLTALVVLGAAVASVAIEDEAAKFFESLEVPLVSIEVIVTDRSGNPVLDLTAEDFQVFENGRQVEISHFSQPARAADSTATAGQPTLPAVPDRDSYVAFYFDDYNVDPRLRGTALEQLRAQLADGLPEGVHGMVIRFDGSLFVECEPTTDTDKLIAGLDRVARQVPLDLTRDGELLVRAMQIDSVAAPRVGPTGEAGGVEPIGVVSGGLQDIIRTDYLPQIKHYVSQRYHRSKDSLAGLESFIRYLEGIHGHKAVVWVGSVETHVGNNLFRTYEARFPNQARAEGLNPTMEALQYDLTDELRDLIQLASTHRVSFYPIGSLGSGVEVNFDYNNTIIEGGGFPTTVGADDKRAIDDAHQFMSRSTGGRTIYDGHLGQQLREVSDELGATYSLAFTPVSDNDERYHRIRINVSREGATVRHRHGYRATDNTDQLADRTLTAALLGITENPLEIDISSREVEERDDGLFLVPVAVDIPLGNLVLTPDAEQHVARVSVLSVVRDEEGRLSDVHQREYPITIANDQLLASVDSRATVVLGMVLRAGPHRITVGVRDEYSSIESTGYVDVAVPDAAGESTG
jgi:VWFA-related protein